ncbi:MAG: pantoate--beta-alanine ligase [Chloroflexota bacterium]
MYIATKIEEVRRIRAGLGEATVGLVPTMGYLHEGHLELVRRARSETNFVSASIFVNPTQFGPNEDLSRYPRDLERDLELLTREAVDLVFVPDDEEIYPVNFQTRIVVDKVSRPLEGARRPTHFEGVTTVVAKLFNIIQPTQAYFGQKDAQQTVVIRQMIQDLDFNIELVICPTVRESSGLAMSSRNKYLDGNQLQAATVLFRSLKAAEKAWNRQVRDGQALREEMLLVLNKEPLAEVDYVSAADPEILVEWESSIPSGKGVLLSLAVFVGPTRLIDNLLLTDSP